MIIESNAIAKYWKSDLLFLVLDPRQSDFKDSARSVLRTADAFVFRSPYRRELFKSGPVIPESGRANFLHPLKEALPPDLRNFVRQHFLQNRHHRGGQSGRIFS
ncbi:MAG: hypothetical protein ACRD5M_01035 [Candidatus Acidiferrales bacterium]